MLTSRRDFLKWSGAAAAASGLAKPLGIPIGLQPYTVRNELAKDLEGTLRKIAEMGYEAIEAGVPFNGRDAAATHTLFRSLRLTAPSGHFAAPAGDAAWAESIEGAHTLGMKYMITTVPGEWRRSRDGWKRGAEMFNKLGAQTKKAGIALAYHNHHFEFKVWDGVTGYEEFLRSTDPDLVKLEMDIFWAAFAGQDPLAWFDRYPGRFQLWHVKDLKPGFPPSTDDVKGNPFAEVGSGTIDWKRIFGAAKQAGLRYYFVEQDRWDRPPLESARMSCEFLKSFRA